MELVYNMLPHSELTAEDIPQIDALINAIGPDRRNFVTLKLTIALRAVMRALDPDLDMTVRHSERFLAVSILDQLELMPPHIWRDRVGIDRATVISTMRAYMPIFPLN